MFNNKQAEITFSKVFNQLRWIEMFYAQMLFTILFTLIKEILILSTLTTVIKTSKKQLVGLSFFLKKHSLLNYTQLLDIVAEDTPKHKNRFRISYVLSSFLYSHKLLISLTAHELHYLPSLIVIFFSAGWLEREVWDLFGLYFVGNFDLRRILTDYGFLGHPLRKDFPLSGFSEIYYALDRGGIVTVPIELTQAYRIFI
jgi:NADH:ubiquinone oxidoreductase subunit C